MSRFRSEDRNGQHPPSGEDRAVSSDDFPRRPNQSREDPAWYQAAFGSGLPPRGPSGGGPRGPGSGDRGGKEFRVCSNQTGSSPTESKLLKQAAETKPENSFELGREATRIWYIARQVTMVVAGTVAVGALTAATLLQPSAPFFGLQVLSCFAVGIWNYQFLILKPFRRPKQENPTALKPDKDSSLAYRAFKKFAGTFAGPEQRAWLLHFGALLPATCAAGALMGGLGVVPPLLKLAPLALYAAESYFMFRKNSTFVPDGILRDVLNRAETYFDALERARRSSAAGAKTSMEDAPGYGSMGLSPGDIDRIGGVEYMDKYTPKRRK